MKIIFKIMVLTFLIKIIFAISSLKSNKKLKKIHQRHHKITNKCLCIYLRKYYFEQDGEDVSDYEEERENIDIPKDKVVT